MNIDSYGAKDGLLEGLLHFLTEKNGYLKTALKAHERAEEAFLSTNVEQEILESAREGIGDLLAYGVGVEKGYTDFVKKSITDFLDNTYKDNIGDGSYKNLNELQMGSLTHSINISSHTLPQNFPDRNAVKKAEIDARIEKIAQYLHPNVKKYVPQTHSAFYDFKIPPTENSVFDCYRKVFESYFALPESEMEWNKSVTKS